MVVDASVLVDAAVLGRPHPLDEPQAPEMLVLEVANALRRNVRLGALSPETAKAAIEDLVRAPITFWPHAPLALAVWTLRDELTAYDASYLALAQSLPGAELVTADAGLAAVAERHLGAQRVRLLA